MAEKLGVPYPTVRAWVRTGAIPAPAYEHPGRKRRLYTEDDVETIRRIVGRMGYVPHAVA